MRKILLFWVLFILVSIQASYAQTPKFNVGDKVKANSTINVRTISNGIANPTPVGQHYFGDQGTVTAGPVSATLNGTPYVWYNVSWSTSPTSGWSVESGLDKVLTDGASFVSKTVSDNTQMNPGQGFTQTFRMRNSGTSIWTTGVNGYTLNFISGSQMGASSYITLSSSVSPGNTVDISVPMTAPTSPGTYTGYWRMNNSSGVFFGDQVSIQIIVTVTDNPPTVTTFDVTPSKIVLSNSVTISYSVSDDIGLASVELWRTDDSSGVPKSTWTKLNTKTLSNQKSYSGNFSVIPTNLGIYWYGIHVVDNKGQWSTEKDAGLGPKKTTVIFSSSNGTFIFPVQPIGEWTIYQGGDFGEYRPEYLGYHSGEDWNWTIGDDNGKPVFAVSDGTIFKVDDLGSLGWCIVLEHIAPEGKSFIIPAKNTNEYNYATESVTKIYSVYIHITNLPDVTIGHNINKGSIVGYIMNPGGGAHLHFEIRHPNAQHSAGGSMLLPIPNWAPNKTTTNNGHYLNVQTMVNSGARKGFDFINANLSSVGVFENKHLPVNFALHNNYPNPFNPSTIISYNLPQRSFVKLEIFNSLGLSIDKLVNSLQDAGHREVTWHAKVSSGVYFYRISVVSIDNPNKQFINTKKMILLR